LLTPRPNAKALGYFQASLRDNMVETVTSNRLYS
jgi:hypothetical protein